MMSVAVVEILPFDEELVEVRQPWLTKRQLAKTKVDPLREFRETYSRDIPKNFFTRYILTRDLQIVEEPNLTRWGAFLEQDHRCLQSNRLREGAYRRMPDYRPGGLWISTVFVGATREDLFETMIFGGWLDQTQVRCDNYKEAMLNHKYAIDVALRLDAWIRVNGRWAKKLHVRWLKFWDLARKRGPHWAIKHEPAGQWMMDQIRVIPGQPPFPEPNMLLNLARMFLPRHDFNSDGIAI
jgi:hypothetical protein